MARGDRSSTVEPEASTSSDAKETDEERLRRRKDEDMIVARAKAIREKIRALDARANVKTHDESRRKSHWEYVLTEMTWLARDFASERDWKQETSRQVSHLAASCDGVPVSAEDAEVNRRKVRCAMVAAEIATFWANAWERAKEKPLPHADELIELEEDNEDEGDDDNDNDDADTDMGDADDDKSTPAPKVETEVAKPLPGLAATPPPPPGMKIISSWASNKLYLAMVEMKRDLVRDAIEIKEAKDAKERQKATKKTTKKTKAAAKPTRGRGGKKKDEPEEAEEDDEDYDDSPNKSDKHSRVAIAEALEIDGMDMDMGLLAPPTPPLIEEFMPIIYDAVPLLNERVYRDTMQIEAHKFAEYERSLRGWEENERKRSRALVEAARYQAEEEAHRETMEQRRTFLAAAAARGFYFDEEGFMVDAKGKRKKNKRGEWIQFGAPGHEADMDFGVPIPKRSGVGLDGKRLKDKKRRKAGAMRPWSPMEDQLLCAIVHEFGSNWALITDAFAASTPIKGVYHRIEHCRWRFSHLTQLAETEHDENAIAALNLNKGSARNLMARALPVEDETVRIHFDRSCAVMAKHMKIRKAAKLERVGMDKSLHAAPHRSWRDVQAICGGVLSPVELADQALMMAPAGNHVPVPVSISPGAQRLGTMLPMMPPRGSIPSGGMPASASARGSGKTPSKKKAAGNELQQLQLMGSYSPAAGGVAMQLGGIGSGMPAASASKSPALAPGSYNIGGRNNAPAVKRTTATKRKAGRRK